MDWNRHSHVKGMHAYLSPSRHHWINYDANKLALSYRRHAAAARGTRIHAFAEECIKLGQRLPRNTKTLNMFVNDSIGYCMDSEVMVYYSVNSFGTVDSISFQDGLLRAFDLKTGAIPGHEDQLKIYAALFCLEYGKHPNDITFDLRIYQADEILLIDVDPVEIIRIMSLIRSFDELIEELKEDMP